MNSFSWKTIRNKLKNMKRTDWLIVLLAGLLLLIFAIPSGTPYSGKNQSGLEQEKDVEKSKEEAASDAVLQADDYKQELEKELETVLSRMEGVGKVEVMITLKNDGENVLDKDVSSDSNGYQENTVVYQLEEKEAPYITSQRMPEMEGVVVVAEGGGNPATVSAISDVVTALFGVETHKVKVVKMTAAK